jgi:hypothetical protein
LEDDWRKTPKSYCATKWQNYPHTVAPLARLFEFCKLLPGPDFGTWESKNLYQRTSVRYSWNPNFCDPLAGFDAIFPTKPEETLTITEEIAFHVENLVRNSLDGETVLCP